MYLIANRLIHDSFISYWECQRQCRKLSDLMIFKEDARFVSFCPLQPCDIGRAHTQLTVQLVCDDVDAPAHMPLAAWCWQKLLTAFHCHSILCVCVRARMHTCTCVPHRSLSWSPTAKSLQCKLEMMALPWPALLSPQMLHSISSLQLALFPNTSIFSLSLLLESTGVSPPDPYVCPSLIIIWENWEKILQKDPSPCVHVTTYTYSKGFDLFNLLLYCMLHSLSFRVLTGFTAPLFLTWRSTWWGNPVSGFYCLTIQPLLYVYVVTWTQGEGSFCKSFSQFSQIIIKLGQTYLVHVPCTRTNVRVGVHVHTCTINDSWCLSPQQSPAFVLSSNDCVDPWKSASCTKCLLGQLLFCIPASTGFTPVWWLKNVLFPWVSAATLQHVNPGERRRYSFVFIGAFLLSTS